jgi:hypothetical protein
MQNLLSLLPLLACPLGMAIIGGVIWLFVRANGTQAMPPNEPLSRGQRLALLRSQQDAVAAEVQHLTADQRRETPVTTSR